MGTVIMETAHTGKCATPLASVKSVYAYAGPTGVFRWSSAVRADGPRRPRRRRSAPYASCAPAEGMKGNGCGLRSEF